MDPIAWLESTDAIEGQLRHVIAVKTLEMMKDFNEDLANRIVNKIGEMLSK